MALKVQDLPGRGGIVFIINNAKFLQFKQNNLSIVQRIHKVFSLKKNVIADFFVNC